MAYVDGFVLPLPKSKIEAYRAIAETAATVWREHGALEYREWIADDVKPGKLTSFPQSVNWKTARPSCLPGSPMRRASSATRSMKRSCKTRAWPT